MKTKHVYVAIALAGAFAIITATARSQDGGAGKAKDKAPAGMKPPGMDEMKQMMEKMEKLAKPGPEHKALADMEGSWNVTTRMWMGGPGTPPSESTGAAEFKWRLGGRFLEQTVKQEMMMPDMAAGGVKKFAFEGIGMIGFDNARKLYVGTWMDNMGTQILTMKGSMPPNTNTLTMYGEMDEPELGVYGRTVKYVWNLRGRDRFMFEIYDLHAGDKYRVMELTYTRKPAGN